MTVDEKCCLPPPAENSIFKTLQKNTDEISFDLKKKKREHTLDVAAFCGSQINDPAAVVAAVDPF